MTTDIATRPGSGDVVPGRTELGTITISTRVVEKVAARAAAEDEPAWTYPALIERWGERYWAGERDAADALLADLDRLAASSATGRRKR